MQTAPFSWRAATNRAPASRSAFVTVRLPLPSRPNAASTPRPASALPTASATSMARRSGPERAAQQHHADDRKHEGDDRDEEPDHVDEREHEADDRDHAERPAREHQAVGALLALAAAGPGSGPGLEIAHAPDHANVLTQTFTRPCAAAALVSETCSSTSRSRCGPTGSRPACGSGSCSASGG